MTVELPHPLAEPLHIVPRWLPPSLLTALLVTLIAAFAVLLLRWLRRQQPAPAPVPTVPLPATGPRFADEVESIRREYADRSAYRSGLHALAGVVRRRVQRLSGLDTEDLTIGEIVAQVRGEVQQRFLRELRERQFGRTPPRRGELDRLCKEAVRQLGDGARIELEGGR